MQRKGIRGWMWRLFGPLLLSYAVSVIVELVVVLICSLKYLSELTVAIETEEQVYEHVLAMTESLVPYSTQIGALAALVTLPFLIRMVKKDRILEQAEGFIPNKVAPVKNYPFLVIMSIAVAVGLNNILLLLNISEYSDAYQEAAELLYAPSFGVQLLCLGIIYPILEEYIFRGLIFRRMRTKIPAFSAMTFSAALFGMYHGNTVQMIYGAISGLMLAYFYEKFGTLKAPILGHVVINIVAVVLTEVDAFTWMFAVPIRMAVITIVCAALGSSMFVLIRRIEEKPDVAEVLPDATEE